MICMTMHTIMLILQWGNITESILESKGMCGCGWVWVGVGDCTVYNYLKMRNKSIICMTMHTIMLILQWRNITGSILESKGMCGIFQKKGQKKKGEILENVGKNVQNMKIFWKKARDCVRLLNAINCYNRSCIMYSCIKLLIISQQNYCNQYFFHLFFSYIFSYGN